MKAIENLLKKFRHRTSQGTDEKILVDATEALEESTKGQISYRRIIKILEVVAAAAIIIAVMIILKTVLRTTGKPEEPPIATETVQKEPEDKVIVKVKTAQPKLEVELKVDKKTPKFEMELKTIIEMFAAGDVNGLLQMLNTAQLEIKLIAAQCLGKIGDEKALAQLEQISSQFSVSSPNEVNPYAEAIEEIRKRQQKKAEVNDVEITIKPMVIVTGLITYESGNPVNDANLEFTPLVTKDKAVDVNLWEQHLSWQVYPDGFFEVSVLSGAPFQLKINKPGFEYIVKLEDANAGEKLDLGRIILTPLTGFNEDTEWDCTLTGMVINEINEPVNEAKVSATGGNERFEVKTNTEGIYRFEKLPTNVQMEMAVCSDSAGCNPFQWKCPDKNNELNIKVFPPAWDLYGKEAPGLFVKEWLNTEPITLEQLKGKVVLLHLGIDLSRYLQNYLISLEQINDILEKFSQQPLTVITIHKHLQDRDKVIKENIIKFVEENSISFPFAIDDEMEKVKDLMPSQNLIYENNFIQIPSRGLNVSGATHSIYEVKSEPAYYLIDKKGILRAAPNQKNLEEWIELLFEESR